MLENDRAIKHFMSNHIAHRTANTLALLASLVFLGWPAIVRGNCCCEQSSPKPVAADSDSPSACCQTASACCTTPIVAKEIANNCDPAIDLGGCCRYESGQKCGVRCCKGLTAVALRIVNPNEVTPEGLLLAEARVEYPSGIAVQSDEAPAYAIPLSPSAGSLRADLPLVEVTSSCQARLLFQT